MKKQPKALLLFSGGLDSILAAKVLQKQKIEVVGLTFVSYFFDCAQAEKSAKIAGIKLIKKDFSNAHLEIVKKPKYAKGKGLNPCIDCHALMLKFARKIAKEKGFDIIATGEVLGQRPLSQNKRALQMIEKETGLEGKILRPLSAKLLDSTIYEEKKLVSREELLEISGRGRGKQLELAGKIGVHDFPTPAGGCRLTEKEFSAKLQDLLDFVENPKKSDFELIRFGRHYYGNFQFSIFNFQKKSNNSKTNIHIILGRNKEENGRLEKLTEKGDWVVKRKDTLGPTALVRIYGNEINEEVIRKTKKLILKYSKKPIKNKKSFKILEI